MKNYLHTTLDIETLSVRPTAIVLSISAIAFNPFEITTDFSENPKLDLLLSIEEQEGRDVQDETVNWWAMQAPEVQAKIFGDSNRLPVTEALEQLSHFVANTNTIWCQGPTLDISVLTNLYESYKLWIPWPYHIIRDSRTLLDLVEVQQPPVTHDSLADCTRQIMGVQQALALLGVQKFVRNR